MIDNRGAVMYTTGKAILTALIGWLLIWIIAALLTFLFGVGPGWVAGVL